MSTDSNDLLSIAGTATGNYWIGYVDELVEGSFGWLDGNSFTYENWCTTSTGCGADEPNGGVVENCAEVYNDVSSEAINVTGYWNDGDCANIRRFTCSYRP